jgi:hypothetical protein
MSQFSIRRAVLASLALAALACAGCLGRNFSKKEPLKPAIHGQLVSTWDNKVAFAPDFSRGGAVMPGLVGRVYLFGPDLAVPYIGDGKLVVDLYDATPRGPDSEPKLTDHFEIDPQSLSQFAKTDFVGDGYTIFFPWFNYRPEVKQVYLQMRYTAANGESFFHQSGTFSVDHAGTRERMQKGMPINNPIVKEAAALQ